MPPITPKIIDPQPGAKCAFTGRIVCMDDKNTVHKSGTVYVQDGDIIAVQSTGAPPAGFESIKPIDTKGTIYPGLIELHNHLSYDILQLWNVPKKFTNRNTWANSEPQYKQLVSGPMTILGQDSTLLPALVRFVECKCLIAGVTTSQGIALNSSAGIRKFYSGVIRTVERPDDKNLPAANTRIPDLAATDRAKFEAELKKATCMLLHLSEGTDEAARQHFLALQSGTDWAITPALCGIHCVALQPADFDIMKKHGGSMVWSPMSNLLLYGQTADVASAKKSGLTIGIGSDWSPSGSKNLLCELKVAQLYSQKNNDIFSDQEIVAMATRNAAAILKWNKLLGSIEAGKHADLLIIDGATGDPYAHLIAATEDSIRLVVIHGVPQYGIPALMDLLGATGGESLTVGSTKFRLHLTSNDPAVPIVPLSQAKKDLSDALANLPNHHAAPAARAAAVRAAHAPQWTLELDELHDTGVELRPRLPMNSKATGAPRPLAAPKPKALKSLKLDGLTVVDDAKFISALTKEMNLPPYIATGLKKAYGP